MAKEELLSLIFFSVAMFINGSLFMVQGVKIYRNKNAKDLSFITFIGFSFIQIAILFYAYVRKDVPLFLGTSYNLLGCIVVSLLIIKYR